MPTQPTPPDPQGSSTRPYLIRALHEWCTDQGFTPYLAVHVDERVKVPNEYVKNGEIVLNIGFDATQGLKLGNEVIEFRARFGGVAREIAVPVDHVIAIYARENGQGMAFPMPHATRSGANGAAPVDGARGASAPLTAVPAHAEGVAVGPRPARVSSGGGDVTRLAPNLRLAATDEPGARGPDHGIKPPATKALSERSEPDTNDTETPDDPNSPSGGGRPTLKRVK